MGRTRAVPGGSGRRHPGNEGCTGLAFWRFLGRGLAIRNHATSHAISLMHPHRAPQASIEPASRENLIVRGFSYADNLSAQWTTTLLASYSGTGYRNAGCLE